MSLKRRLSEIKGIQWHWTAGDAKQEGEFRHILDKLRPTSIVEIGTHQGVSTALLAEYAYVTTVDIFPNPIRERVWRALGVRDRITERVCRGSRERDEVIRQAVASADLAFVDGCHLMPDVERDFRLTIPCGRVILHDYWLSPDSWPDVKEFVDGLDRTTYDVNVIVPFALVIS